MKADCSFSCLLSFFTLSIHKVRCESPKSCLRSPHKCAKAETSKPEGCTELLSLQDLHLLSFLASWTTSMEFVAGAVQKKASYKEAAPRQTLRTTTGWVSSSGSSTLLTGRVWGLQVRSAITLLALDISHRDSEQPVGQTCVHTLAMSDRLRAPTTCPILPSKTEEKTVLILAIVLMPKDPGYSTVLKLTFTSC